MTNTEKQTTQQPREDEFFMERVNYYALRRILSLAYEQAAFGKGKERHANARPFDEQPIIDIGMVTGPGGTSFQAMKKITEALRMFERGDGHKAIFELCGAIVYCAATVLVIERKQTGGINPRHVLTHAPNSPAPNETPIPPVKQDGPFVRITEARHKELCQKERLYNAVQTDVI